MRASCCALLLCLLALALPARAEEPRPGDRVLTSGPYTIRVREGHILDPGGFVSISRNGRVLVTLRDAVILHAEIRPLLGPESADLVVETYSGGAHCCSVIYLIHLGKRLDPLLTFNANNFHVFDLQDLDHDGRQECIAWDDSFAWFGDLGFTTTPEIPFVFCYEDGRYRDATARFRWLVAAEQEKAKRNLVEAVHRPVAAPGPDEGESQEALARRLDMHQAAVEVYADGVLLGQQGQAERWLKAQLPPEDWSWFYPLRHDIRLTVLTRDRKLTYRLREPPIYNAYWRH